MQSSNQSLSKSRLWLYFALLMVLYCGAFVSVFWAGHAPYVDSGGYEKMLQYFLATGKVDYMRWCQPSFLGVLPVACAWVFLFGSSTPSLQVLGICYGVVLVAGIYLFASKHVEPLCALAIAGSVGCFPDFLSVTPTFMTDIPYLAYLVWFLNVHFTLDSTLTERSDAPRLRGTFWLWVTWSVLLLFACSIRAGALVVLPMLIALCLTIRKWPRRAAILYLLLSIGVLALGFAMIRLIGERSLSVIELTVYREVVLDHDWARFNLRALGCAILEMAVVALPALTLSVRPIRQKTSWVEIVIGISSLLMVLHFWRKGVLTDLTIMPVIGGVPAWVSLFPAVLAPFGVVYLYRLIKGVISGNARNSEYLVILIMGFTFAALPITQQPVPRHVLSAFVALLLLVAATLRHRPQPAALAVVLIAITALVLRNLERAQYNLAVTESISKVCKELVRREARIDDIFGGWDWFCYYDLKPGSPDPVGYDRRYHQMEASARYVVITSPGCPPNAIYSVRVHSKFRVAYAYAVERAPIQQLDVKGNSLYSPSRHAPTADVPPIKRPRDTESPNNF
jgi:hypothetical protein